MSMSTGKHSKVETLKVSYRVRRPIADETGGKGCYMARRTKTTWVVFTEDEVFETTNILTAEQMFEKYPNACSIEAFDWDSIWS
jgi:hypothetical protein